MKGFRLSTKLLEDKTINANGKNNNLEILAPAGDEKSAYAAINSGANAIYLGLTDFSARSSATNFDFPSLSKLILYAHTLKVKIYVAMNTLIKNSELNDFVHNAVSAWNAGADAIIMQDFFVARFLKERFPQMVLHLSTQAGINNVYGAKFAKECGFDRVILARETGLEDIKQITKIIETEVFVQGALCTCFSGQCYLSSFAGGNSGNRGKCKQPCRKMYTVDRSGFEEQSYAISLSDLSVGENITKLAEAGVTSFKIEGRMRRPEYVAAAVSYYKKMLDGVATDADKSALKRTFNRGNFTQGLAFGQDKSFVSSAVQGHIGEYLGTVKVVDKRYICQTSAKCANGDGFKILREGKEVGGASYGGECKGGFYINATDRLKNGDKVFITTDTTLNERLLRIPEKLADVHIEGSFICGNRAQIFINGQLYESEFIVDVATNRPTTAEDIQKSFNKKDTYPFNIIYDDIRISDNAFVPASLLNEFRRNIYSTYFNEANANRQIDGVDEFLNDVIANYGGSGKSSGDKSINEKVAVIAQSLKGLNVDIGILKPDDYCISIDSAKRLIDGFNGEKFIFLPVYFKGEEIERVKPLIELFDGIYSDGYYAVTLAREMNKKLFAGTGFNLSNTFAMSLINADYIGLSKELTVKEVMPLVGDNTFYLTAGDIKVMDLVYCPFGKTCAKCDRKRVYELTDENGRKFPLKRYQTDEYCRFEIYNCASLVCRNNFTGKLMDCTIEQSPQSVIDNIDDEASLKKIFKAYTRGHSDSPIL